MQVMYKVLEAVVMALALVAFMLHSFPALLGVIFLMGLQSTLFGPSKYGSIPEMVETKDLTRANGLIQMTTFLAIIFGAAIGGQRVRTHSDAYPRRPHAPYTGSTLSSKEQRQCSPSARAMPRRT